MTLVEKDQGALVALTKNAALLDAQSSVVDEDVEVFLQREPSPYQLVVLDPPYETDVDPVLAQLRPWLADGACRRRGAAHPWACAAAAGVARGRPLAALRRGHALVLSRREARC